MVKEYVGHITEKLYGENEPDSENKYVMESEQPNGISCKLHETTDMSKKNPPLDPTKLKHNPFAQDLIIPAIEWTDCGKFVWNEDLKKMVSASAVIEQEKYTRVYRKAGLRDHTMKLSPTALKLLMWMMQDIEDGNDWVRVMPEWYAKHGGKGASRTQYTKAVEELSTEGFICKTQYKYTYWVNPAIMCGGNRVDKYPDKVIVKGKW